MASVAETASAAAATREGEPRANDIRQRLNASQCIGQRTFTPTQLVVDKAKGVVLTSADGRQFIDYTSGVLVANLGHGNPDFERKYQQYSEGLPRNAYNMVTAIEVEASERLVASMPSPKAQKILWAASGSEGIQKAMWAAQHKHPDRPIMLATRHGFHGKKGLAGDVTGSESKNPNVRFISFPMYEEKPASFYRDELDALAKEFPEQISLLITEPYLGAAGSFHPPKWYHQLLQEWCEQHDVAFIFDEVQACHGRTGNMYAFESYEVQPDLVVLGKGVANGEPAACVVGRADLLDSFDYGEASDTFSGTPRACAAACATLDLFEEQDIVGKCREMAPVVRQQLDQLASEFSFIKAVRGEGLVFGVEICDNETAQRAVLEAYKGVEGGTGITGVHFLGPLAGKVLRVSPPLVITRDEVDQAGAILKEAWKRI
jgi:4-aminobutyrate aminotransferase-like enzyme